MAKKKKYIRKNLILTLTPSVEKNIKKNYSKLRLTNYGGEALELIHRLRLIDNVGKNNYKNGGIQLKPGLVLLPGTFGYSQLVTHSKDKGLTIKGYLRKAQYRNAFITYVESRSDVEVKQEVSYIVNMVKNLRRGIRLFISWNGKDKFKRISKNAFIKALVDVEHICVRENEGKVIMTYWSRLNGDLYFKMPNPEGVFEEMDFEDMIEYLDEFFPNILIISSDPKKGKKGTNGKANDKR